MSERPKLSLKKEVPPRKPEPPTEEDFDLTEFRRNANATLDAAKQDLYASGLSPADVSKAWTRMRTLHDQILKDTETYKATADGAEKAALVKSLRAKFRKLDSGAPEELEDGLGDDLHDAKMAALPKKPRKKGPKPSKEDSLKDMGKAIGAYTAAESEAHLDALDDEDYKLEQRMQELEDAGLEGKAAKEYERLERKRADIARQNREFNGVPELPGQDQDLPFATIEGPVTPRDEKADNRAKLSSLIEKYNVTTNYGPMTYTPAESSPTIETVAEEEEVLAEEEAPVVESTSRDLVPVPQPEPEAPNFVLGEETTPKALVPKETNMPVPYEENPMQLMQSPVLNKIIMEGRSFKEKKPARRKTERKSLSMGGTKHMHTDLGIKPDMPAAPVAAPMLEAPKAAQPSAPKKKGGFFGFLGKNPRKKAVAGAGVLGLAGILAAIGLSSGEHGSTSKKAPEKKGDTVPAAKSAKEAGVRAPAATAPSEATPPPQTVKKPESVSSPAGLKAEVAAKREREITTKKVLAIAVQEAAKPDSGVSLDDVTLLQRWQQRWGGFPTGADKNIRKVIEIVRANPDNQKAFEDTRFEPVGVPEAVSAPLNASPEADEAPIAAAPVIPEAGAAESAPEHAAGKESLEIDTHEPHAYSAMDEHGKKIIVMYGGAGDAAFLAAQQYAATLPEGSVVRFEAYDVDEATGVSRPMYGAFRSNGPGVEATPQFRNPETDESYDTPVDKSRFDRRLDFTFARS